MPESEGASRLEADQVGRGEDAENTSQRVSDDQMVGCGIEHVDHRVHREPVGADDHGRQDDPRDRVLR